jgi:hypothetical protein
MSNDLLRAVLSRLLVAATVALMAFTPAAGQKNCGKEKEPYAGVIISIDPKSPAGKLRVRLSSREKPFNAEEGMTVRRSAVLELAEGASAVVVCGDKVKHNLKPGLNPVPCTDNSFVSRNGSCVARTRGGDSPDGTFPVVVSPRRTLLLSRRPTLRWTPVVRPADGPGTAAAPVEYTVNIFTEGMELVWSEKTTATVLAYPGNRPELTPGDYLLVVTAAGFGSSEDEHVPNIGFTVLEDCKPQAGGSGVNCTARQVRSELEAIRKLGLPADAEKLLVAYAYKEHELYAEAIETLNSMSATSGPPIVRLLGDIYGLTGLNREAERAYLKALSLPQMADDPEDKALALSALAETYEALGARANAKARWDEAIKVYEALGDKELVNELKQRRDHTGGQE